MKTAMLTLGALAIGLYASAQKLSESQVPADVLKAFKTNFSTVATAKWEKENMNYEANFELNKVETSAIFDAHGNHLETETELVKSSLPKPVLDALVNEYSGYKIGETSKIDAKGIISYEVEVEKGEHSMDLIFDKKGTLLKTVPKENKEKR